MTEYCFRAPSIGYEREMGKPYIWIPNDNKGHVFTMATHWIVAACLIVITLHCLSNANDQISLRTK